MKNILELADTHSQKENQALASLLFIGFVGSACVHAAAMITPVPSLWKTNSTEPDDTIEIGGEASQPDAEKFPEIAKEPEPILPVNEEIPQVEVAPEAIALAPETPTLLKEGKDVAAPDHLKPLLTIGTSDTKIQEGGGSIIAKDGTGSGFGNAKIPTGFVLGGKINGNPNGKKDGVIGGSPTGRQDGKGIQTSVLPPVPTTSTEKRPPQLECLSCPKPQYRGKEGTPRVTYDIAPDGRVMNLRLRQSSGDAQTDRETIEAMSQWQFNPQTVPEGGRTNVRVRVTFEEEGSNFQRENEARRLQAAEKLAEQERQQQESARSLPASTAIAPVNNPSSDSSSSPSDNNSPPERSLTSTSVDSKDQLDSMPSAAPIESEPSSPAVPVEPTPPAPVESKPILLPLPSPENGHSN